MQTKDHKMLAEFLIHGMKFFFRSHIKTFPKELHESGIIQRKLYCLEIV